MSIDNLHLRSYTTEFCQHKHDFYQWVLPLAGTLELQVGDQSDLLTLNKGALVSYQERHCFYSQTKNLFLVMDVPKDSWLKHIEICPFWEVSPEIQKFLCFGKEYLAANKDSSKSILVNDFLQKLLCTDFLSKVDPIIIKAKNWIDQNYANPLDLKLLAKLCCLSVSQLQRRFKRVIGMCIGHYWRSAKLNKAKFLLQATQLKIETIAITVGYEDLAIFSRSFSKNFNISPSEWRRMQTDCI